MYIDIYKGIKWERVYQVRLLLCGRIPNKFQLPVLINKIFTSVNVATTVLSWNSLHPLARFSRYFNLFFKIIHRKCITIELDDPMFGFILDIVIVIHVSTGVPVCRLEYNDSLNEINRRTRLFFEISLLWSVP